MDHLRFWANKIKTFMRWTGCKIWNNKINNGKISHGKVLMEMSILSILDLELFASGGLWSSLWDKFICSVQPSNLWILFYQYPEFNNIQDPIHNIFTASHAICSRGGSPSIPSWFSDSNINTTVLPVAFHSHFISVFEIFMFF